MTRGEETDSTGMKKLLEWTRIIVLAIVITGAACIIAWLMGIWLIGAI